MSLETYIPWPVRFNPFKHHRNYILSILQDASPEEIRTLLDPVCNNYIDIYTGTLTPEAIGNDVVGILKSKQVLLPDDFEKWVSYAKGYRQIKLPDGSEWILRKSNEAERYIHLHPARTGSFCYRFKGSTLKTVFLLKSVSHGVRQMFTLQDVNQIRLQIGLSPVKKLEKGRGILNCYERFF